MVRLCANLPDKDSEYSEEGDAAHKLAELVILRLLKRIREQNYKIKLAKMMKGKYYEPAMMEYVQQYAAYVMAAYAKALKIDRKARIYVETRLNMTRWVPEGFGTADILIVFSGHLWFIDLKYGKGVSVYADKNKQLMLYALGALDLFELFYDNIEKVSLTIFQPRIDNTSTYETTADDLIQWADTVLKPIAEKAFKGEGEFVAGDHCQFCNAKSVCKANAKHKLSLAKHAFKDPPLMNDEDIADVLTKYAGLLGWAKSVHEHALSRAVAGHAVPGFKLVAGRSDRKITDILAASKVLRDAGYDRDEIYQERKLKGIGELEALLGKKDFGFYLNDVIFKPYGQPTLVPESDKRPVYSKAKAAKNAFK